jgi:hypothetical protein
MTMDKTSESSRVTACSLRLALLRTTILQAAFFRTSKGPNPNQKGPKPNLYNLSLYKTIISLTSPEYTRSNINFFFLKLSPLAISLMISVSGYNLSREDQTHEIIELWSRDEKFNGSLNCNALL